MSAKNASPVTAGQHISSSDGKGVSSKDPRRPDHPPRARSPRSHHNTSIEAVRNEARGYPPHKLFVIGFLGSLSLSISVGLRSCQPAPSNCLMPLSTDRCQGLTPPHQTRSDNVSAVWNSRDLITMSSHRRPPHPQVATTPGTTSSPAKIFNARPKTLLKNRRISVPPWVQTENSSNRNPLQPKKTPHHQPTRKHPTPANPYKPTLPLPQFIRSVEPQRPHHHLTHHSRLLRSRTKTPQPKTPPKPPTVPHHRQNIRCLAWAEPLQHNRRVTITPGAQPAKPRNLTQPNQAQHQAHSQPQNPTQQPQPHTTTHTFFCIYIIKI